MSRSKVKVTGDKKTRNSVAFCLGVVLWGMVLVAFFSGAFLGGVAMPVGKSVHAA